MCQSNAELEARMRPGALSRAGFLGPSENLQGVLDADRLALDRAGLTFEALAGALATLIVAAQASTDHEATVGETHCVQITQYLGFQICPWSPDPRQRQCALPNPVGLEYASLDWRVENSRTGQAQQGPGLMIHLMHDHHFCEGHQTPYRVDPLTLARILDLI